MEPVKKARYSKLDKVQVNVGLQVVYPKPDETPSPKSSRKFNLDIIAIPGLGANAYWTWIKNDVHWLRDSNMLADKIQNARISVFEYQSQWFGSGSIDQRLENVADQLLYKMERMREESHKTPIIFICHCLGGIVLERALLIARLRQNRFPSIFPWVAGCVFLGTPFHGTKTSEKAMVLAKLAEKAGMGSPSGLLEVLKPRSKVLEDMLDEFVALCGGANIRVFCFHESDESDLVGTMKKGLPFKVKEMIVDKEDAKYPGVENLQLSSDHFGLNKYTGPKDGNFISVSNEIKATAQKASILIKSRQRALEQANITDSTYRSILDFLRKGFVDVDETIKGIHKGSEQGSWIFDMVSFKTWRENDVPHILWIHGGAGTGQGPIASSAIESLDKSQEKDFIVASFFCDEGDENRRSLSSMLKLLIRQIIDTDRELAVPLLTDSSKGKHAGTQQFDPDQFSNAATLWASLLTIAKNLPEGYIYLVICGVEHLADESLNEFFQFLRDIPQMESLEEDSEIAPIKWMLLSISDRPNIDHALKGKALEIDINASENAALRIDALKEDISTLVDELGLPASIGYFAKRHIHTRAEGNHLYVELVIQELKNILDEKDEKAKQFSAIRAKLEAFPYGLTNMFGHIRKRILDPHAEGIEYTKEILRCLDLVRRAPTLRELSIIADLPVEDRDSLEELRCYLRRCGAFVTLRGDASDEESNTVQWIDSSARDHLRNYAKEDLSLDLQDTQHGIIALRCLEYIYSLARTYEPIGGDVDTSEDVEVDGNENDNGNDNDNENDKDNGNDDDSDNGNNSDNVDEDENESKKGATAQSDHAPTENGGEINEDGEDNVEIADTAQSENITADDEENTQGDAFENAVSYPLEWWIEHAKLAPKDVIDEFKIETHHFWAKASTPLQKWWNTQTTIQNQTDVTPLHVAVQTGFEDLVEHLLLHGREEDINETDSIGFQPLYYTCYRGEFGIVLKLLGAGSDINFRSDEDNVTALWGAAQNGQKDIVECLLDRDAGIDANSSGCGSALYAACENNHLDIVQLLLMRGASPNLAGGQQIRPLNIATFTGNTAAVRLLIEHGAEIDPDEDYLYGSALGTAARRGHADIAKLLLSKGWDPMKKMQTYGSFLTAAATYGHQDVFEVLLEQENRITIFEQAVQAAARTGKPEVIKAILNKNSTLRKQKAFMIAAFYGRDEVLEFLKAGIPKDKLNDALYTASDQEHEETVKLLLDFGASPNAEGPEYGCALTASAYDGTTRILETLLSNGADVNKRAGDYGTPLQAAALWGNANNVELLLNHGACVNTEPIGIYGNPLQAACYNGDAETVRVLLKAGADANAYGGKYGYPIIAAASERDVRTINILLEFNANVNVQGGEDNSPVIVLAGLNLARDDIKTILDHGAAIDAVCDHGTTALINCAYMGDREGCELLLERGANLHVVSQKFGTALHGAASEQREEVCQLLIEKGADVNAIGGPYGTVLQAASCAADIDIVKMLLKAGANSTGTENVAGEYGTALQAACFSGNLDVVQELIDHGAVIDLEPANGTYGYPLAAAAIAGHSEVVELLLKQGANVNLAGGLHGYPLLAAISRSANDDTVKMLLEHGAIVSVEGGLLGSAVQAAAYGNNQHFAEELIDRGANVHATGGKYGNALQAAVIKADMDFIDMLLGRGIDVNFEGGKYGTALQAASYRNSLDIVSKLLEKGANFRFRGGVYENALTAAAIKGNTTILDKLLQMSPPDQILDEALVQACANRQTSCVEALLKSGANVYARHPILGLAEEALKTEQPDGIDSDDDEVTPDNDDDDHSDDGENNGSENHDDEWEGDDGSDAGQTDEGSVNDLELEDDVSEETKIERLLNEAKSRVKRNPTIQRFRTVRRKNLPPSTIGGPAQQILRNQSCQQLNPETDSDNTGQSYGRPYGQQQPNQEHVAQPFQNYQNPGPGYNSSIQQGYSMGNNSRNQLYRRPVGSGSTQFSPQEQPQQYQPPPQQQPTTGSGGYGQPAPHDQYSAIPQPSYSSTTPPQQQFSPYAQSQQPQYQYPPETQKYQPYSSPPPSQEPGYIPYRQDSQASSQTSLQNILYANSTQYGGSQQSFAPYGTPSSSQASSFNWQGQGQGRK